MTNNYISDKHPLLNISGLCVTSKNITFCEILKIFGYNPKVIYLFFCNKPIHFYMLNNNKCYKRAFCNEQKAKKWINNEYKKIKGKTILK